jgi:chromosome partitioning protein
MPVVAVINRKGGSGKSTLATHLAAYCVSVGLDVKLADIDRQQSTQAWLRERRQQRLIPCQDIVGWNVDPKAFVRRPGGAEHVILDTPGGLHGFDLARAVMYADAILMPVCNSIFDRQSAADCLAELRTLPRISSGRCKVAAIGMRLDARTKSAQVLAEWAEIHQVPFIAVLRESQAYVRCIEKGLTLFDLPPARVQTDLAQWKPILQWLRPILEPLPRSDAHANGRMPPLPSRRSLGEGALDNEHARPNVPSIDLVPAPAHPLEAGRSARPASPMSRLLGALPIPRFLQRTP